MIRSQADDWSIARSLAFLAATFAIVFGTLLPFAAAAAVQPGQQVVICSAEGTHVITTDDGGSSDEALAGVHCAACLMPVVAALPQPPRVVTVRLPTTLHAEAPRAADDARLPPARAPPRPPSTAPPQA